MKKTYFLIFLIALLGVKLTNAQCTDPTSATITHTDITCRGNGKITISSVNGSSSSLTNYQFALYSATNTTLIRAFQAGTTFNSLDPGDYTVRVRCTGSPTEYNSTMIHVGGTYTEPKLQAINVTGTSTCGSPTATITATATGTSSPFSYCLVSTINDPVSPTYIRPENSTGIFSNLAGGTYFVRVYDGCRNYDTRSVTIDGTLNLSPFDKQDIAADCDGSYQIDFKFNRKITVNGLLTGNQSMTMTTPAGGTVAIPASSNTNNIVVNIPAASLGAARPATVTFTYVDECGQSFNKVYTFNTPSYSFDVNSLIGNAHDCSNSMYNVDDAQLIDANNPLVTLNNYFQYYSTAGPAGPWIPITSTSAITLPNASTTTIWYKDACGTVYPATITASPAVTNSSQIKIFVFGSMGVTHCSNGMGSLYFTLKNGMYSGQPSDIIVTVLQQPATANLPATFHLAEPGGQSFDIVSGGSSGGVDYQPAVVSSLPPGFYQFRFTDLCGNTTIDQYTIVSDVQTISASPVFACGSTKPKITVKFSSQYGGDYYLNYAVFNKYDNAFADTIIHGNDGSYAGSNPPGTSTTETLVIPINPRITNGSAYIVHVWISDGAGNTTATCPMSVEVDIPTTTLTMDRSTALSCPNYKASIIANSIGGNPSFNYTLYHDQVNPANVVPGNYRVSTNTFSNLDNTQTYIVMVEDACGRSSSYQTSFAEPTPTIIPGTLAAGCIGTSYQMSVDNIPGETYQWTKDGINITGATSPTYAIANLSPANSGNYVVNLSAGGCTVASKSVTLNIGASCSILPVTLESFAGKRVDNNDQLSWVTATEINTREFQVEYSTNGQQFIKTGTVNAMSNGSTVQQQYHYTNANVSGDSYYRLRIVDIDGSALYSPVIKIYGNKNLNGSINSNIIYPIPFANKLNINVSSSKYQPATFTLFSIDGKIVAQKSMTLQQGAALYTLNNLNNLPYGTYILRIQSTDGIITEKVVK